MGDRDAKLHYRRWNCNTRRSDDEVVHETSSRNYNNYSKPQSIEPYTSNFGLKKFPTAQAESEKYAHRNNTFTKAFKHTSRRLHPLITFCSLLKYNNKSFTNQRSIIPHDRNNVLICCGCKSFSRANWRLEMLWSNEVTNNESRVIKTRSRYVSIDLHLYELLFIISETRMRKFPVIPLRRISQFFICFRV